MRETLPCNNDPIRASSARGVRVERGVTAVELVTVVAVFGIIVITAVPFLSGFWTRHRVRVASTTVQSLVYSSRIQAVKRKEQYRILVHDESAGTPNRFEVQRKQGGSFVTVPNGVHVLAPGIRILGSGPTNSLDSLTVSERGQCTSGSVYVQGPGTSVETVRTETTCQSSIQ